MRIVLTSMGTEEFALLRAICQRAGHVPVAYAYSRAMRPGERTDEYAATVLNRLLMVLPGDVDLLLPASPAGLGMALSGYRPDLLVIYGFNWILPPEVFQLPRFGTINIHPGRLPRYRGPAPVHWAIRNGDPEIGVSVHRVDDGVDTGPILAQRGGIPLPEEITRERVRDLLAPVVEELLSTALARVVAGDPGEPQPRTGADYAGLMEPEFSRVEWSRTRREIHNQVRVFRYMDSQTAPVGQVGGEWVRLIHTSLEPDDGQRVDCADGPIWIIESAPVSAPPGPG